MVTVILDSSNVKYMSDLVKETVTEICLLSISS